MNGTLELTTVENKYTCQVCNKTGIKEKDLTPFHINHRDAGKCICKSCFTCSKCDKKIIQAKDTWIGNYTYDRDGNRICNKCSAKSILKGLVDTGKGYLFLTYESKDKVDMENQLTGGHRQQKKWIADWHGNKFQEIHHVRKGEHNWYMCNREDIWFRIPGDKYIWHGFCISGGMNESFSCRRTKSTEF